MCNCVKKIAESIEEMYEAKDVMFDIDFYPKQAEHAYPFTFKFKRKNKTIKIHGKYCPFCGERIEVKEQ